MAAETQSPAEKVAPAELGPEPVKPVAEADPAPKVDEKSEETLPEADGDAEVAPALDKEIVQPLFKEESYLVSELKEFEKKALEDFKLRIESAIKKNDFSLPPLPAPKDEKTEELEAAAKTEEAVKEVSVPEDTPAPAEKGEVEPEEAANEAVTASPVLDTPAPLTVELTEDRSAEVDPVKPVPGAANVEKETSPAPQVAVPETQQPAPAVDATEVAKDTIIVEDKPEDPEVDEDISLWGVPLLHTKGDEKTNVILLKFLRARDYNVNQAFSMLKKTIQWRKKFNADGLLDEDFGTELDVAAFMSGEDKEGHPVCYNVWSAFKDKKLYQHAFGTPEKVNTFLRWRIQVLEKGIKQLNFTPEGPHAMVQITDLKNSVLLTTQPSAVKKALSMLQDNYPELVVRKIFLNVPWYFSAPYTILISPFLSQRTKSKIVVATPGKATETLFRFISPDQVPTQYGGLKFAGECVFDGVDVPVSEVTIKPGLTQTIDIPSPSPRATIYWDLSVVGWDVTYGADFEPVEGYTTIVEKAKKIVTAEEPIRTSFPSHGAGKVVITIDNSASKKKKFIVYRYLVKATEAETELAG